MSKQTPKEAGRLRKKQESKRTTRGRKEDNKTATYIASRQANIKRDSQVNNIFKSKDTFLLLNCVLPLGKETSRQATSETTKLRCCC